MTKYAVYVGRRRQRNLFGGEIVEVLEEGLEYSTVKYKDKIQQVRSAYLHFDYQVDVCRSNSATLARWLGGPESANFKYFMKNIHPVMIKKFKDFLKDRGQENGRE